MSSYLVDRRDQGGLKYNEEGFYGWYDRIHKDYMKKPVEEQIEGMGQLTKRYVPEMVSHDIPLEKAVEYMKVLGDFQYTVRSAVLGL